MCSCLSLWQAPAPALKNNLCIPMPNVPHNSDLTSTHAFRLIDGLVSTKGTFNPNRTTLWVFAYCSKSFG